MQQNTRVNINKQHDVSKASLEHAVLLFGEMRHGEAVSVLEALINKGVSAANCYLGMIYEYGNADVPYNYEYARFYYEKAYDDGWTPGYIGLGRIFYYGRGVKQDLRRAFRYFDELNQSDIVNPIADFYLGQMYQLGQFVDIDLDKAAWHYRRSANMGYVWGLQRLAVVEKQRKRYLPWVKLRILLFARAMSHLAVRPEKSWQVTPATHTMGPSRFKEELGNKVTV